MKLNSVYRALEGRFMFDHIRNSPRIAAGAEESAAERPATQMSMVGLKSQSSNSTANRPIWNAHRTKAKYQVNITIESGAMSKEKVFNITLTALVTQSQTEKDPRFLQRRRERLRRRQKLLLEKQLHGSWPSSENSG